MSRCRQTDALLEAGFAGTGLTHDEADHAGNCSECAHALAQARRFDGELHRVGIGLAPEAMPSARELIDIVSVSTGGGGSMTWKRGLVGICGAVVLAAAVLGGGAGIGSLLSGDAPVGRIEAEALGAWVDQALIVAHGEAERGSPRIADWEPAQIETCGRTAVVFFEQRNERGGNYLWAIGRPGDLVDPSIAMGWSMTLGDPDVARVRATLPICEVALGDLEPAGEVIGTLPVALQRVVRVPDVMWEGDPDDAPFLVERIGTGAEDVRVGIRQGAFVYGHLDHPSVRAVDIVTTDGRFRYTVGMPGFVIQADPGDALGRFELLDQDGRVVASGPIREGQALFLEGDGERAARVAAERQAQLRARAEAERRAQEGIAQIPDPRADGPDAALAGARCSAWLSMIGDEQLRAAEALVGGVLERVRLQQQLPEAADRSGIIAGARTSIDKACQGSRPDRELVEIARTLYGGAD